MVLWMALSPLASRSIPAMPSSPWAITLVQTFLFTYAVADAFTLCDNYFSSVIGPTDPNRLYTMAASVDPAGQNGGPLLQTLVANRSSFYGKLT